MNIARYKWPVIIAAGLHGALFVSFPSERMPVLHGKKDDPVWKDPPTAIPIDPVEAPEEGEAAAPGGGEPLPALPDVPVRPDSASAFEVPVVERMASIRPVTALIGEHGPGVGLPGPGIGVISASIAGVDRLDRPPRAMAQPAPVYPHEMRQLGADGSVVVEFIVGIDGRVVSAEAVRSTRREFVEPAVRAVLKWRFEPGTINGRKVRFRMAVPIEFNTAG